MASDTSFGRWAMSVTHQTVRLAIGLRSTAESLAVIARAAGIFDTLGIDLQIPRQETAGPTAVSGLVKGAWELAEFGAVPLVEAVLRGEDTVILLAAEQTNALYILGSADTAVPEDLVGRQIGVLTQAGQTGYSARRMLERWGLEDEVDLKALGQYPEIHRALRNGEIAGGVLTADYRLAGPDFPVLADLGEAFGYQGPVVATTRRLIARDRTLVAGIVRGYVDAIHLFKTDPETVVPILRDHLGLMDEGAVQRIHTFYAPRFSALPRPSRAGISRILDSLSNQYTGSSEIEFAAIHDSSFLDDLERDGHLASLYSGGPV